MSNLHTQGEFPPQVVNRGKFGYAVVYHINGERFESAMPDETTALQAAAAPKLLEALDELLLNTILSRYFEINENDKELIAACQKGTAAIAAAKVKS